MEAFREPITYLIPVIAAVIGWGTNVVAVKMMFSPLRFIGIWKLGWQGIIPANAVHLASKSTDLITGKLLSLKQLFESFDADQFTDAHMSKALDDLTDQVIDMAVERHATAMWTNANDMIKNQVRAMVRADVEKVTKATLTEVGSDIESILDLKDIVITTATKDRALIGRMFLETGKPEFSFIKVSGLYFGFLFGIVQMFAWVAYPAWWVLPLFGFLVGYVTNWLALKLIFSPKEPKKVGPFTFHGLFHKRQQQVSELFAEMLSKEILNTDAMVKQMIEGEGADKLFGIVEKHVGAMLDRYAANPMVSAVMPADKMPEIREEVFAQLRIDLAKPGGMLYVFTEQAINVYSELFERMKELDSESFEGVLRPAFQQDEWKLILAGAALGLGAGALQVIYLFGEQLA